MFNDLRIGHVDEDLQPYPFFSNVHCNMSTGTTMGSGTL